VRTHTEAPMHPPPHPLCTNLNAHTRAHAQKLAHTRVRTPRWSALTSNASMEIDHPAVATSSVATTQRPRRGAIVPAPPLISSTKRPSAALCRATQPAIAPGPVQGPARAPIGRTARPQPPPPARCIQADLVPAASAHNPAARQPIGIASRRV